MTPQTHIRPAEPRDVSTLGRLGALLMRVHYDFDPRRFLAPGPHSEAGYGAFLRSQMREPDTLMLVADRSGAVVGYAYAVLEPLSWQDLRDEAGVIHDLIVDPDHRHAGIGAQLLTAVLHAFAARDVRQVVLSTAAPNTGAQRLFERFGFRRTMIEMTRELEGGH
jgi:ribosomal protein S18 acetylase RimI-like enzyme